MDFQSLGSWHASHSLLVLGFASVRWVGWGPGFPPLYSTQSFWRNSTAVLGSVQSCLLAVLVLFPPQIGSFCCCAGLCELRSSPSSPAKAFRPLQVQTTCPGHCFLLVAGIAPAEQPALSLVGFKAEWLSCQKQRTAMLPPRQTFSWWSLHSACKLGRAGVVSVLRVLAG